MIQNGAIRPISHGINATTRGEPGLLFGGCWLRRERKSTEKDESVAISLHTYAGPGVRTNVAI